MGRPAARLETKTEISPEMKMVSTQTATPMPQREVLSVRPSVRPSALMGDMEISSGYPPPVLREAVTAALSNSRTDVTRTTLSFMTHSHLQFYTVMRIHLKEVANGLAAIGAM